MMQNPHYDVLEDKGPKGDKGDKGDTGSQGIKGDKGDTGLKGDTGSQGPKGPKGDKGDTGSQGPKGPKGDKGDKGDTGIQGVKGDKGDTGSQGPKGDQGAKGRQGDKGDKGDTGAQGPAGTFTTPTADVSFGNHKITNLGNPRDGTDAVNKNYADGKYTNIITPVFLSRAFNITHEPASGTVFNYSNHTSGTRYFLIIVHYLLKLLKSPTDAQSCGGTASASPITHPTIILQHAGAGFRIDFNSNNYKITPLLKSGVIMSQLRVEYMIGFRC